MTVRKWEKWEKFALNDGHIPHNEDGSYTYGYESGDGTFKIETKLPNGEVKGKYGYVDDTGKVRVVEYGATKHGFAPAGEGITVPPPTLVDNRPQSEQEEDLYEQEVAPVRPAITAAKLRPRPKAQPAFEAYSPPQQFEPVNSPVPRRPQIAGAVPAPVETQTFDFGPVARPSPVKSFSPAPKPRPAPVQFAQPAPVENDYELPPRPAKITYAEPVGRCVYPFIVIYKCFDSKKVRQISHWRSNVLPSLEGRAKTIF
nr:unnamed protein product [Callosobruchus analis]